MVSVHLGEMPACCSEILLWCVCDGIISLPKNNWMMFSVPLQIWGPIVFGVGAAIYKAATGTITFDNLVNIILSLVLIVMPITW
jgi:hypothetical protein